MKVTLNIENDAELRSYIKDCIKGQVLAIAREEFTAMVKEELERKLKGVDKFNFERMLRESMKDAVKSILYTEHKVKDWDSDYLKPYVEEIVNKSMKDRDWGKLVDDAAKRLINSLIK